MPYGRKRVFGFVEFFGDSLVLFYGYDLLLSSLFPGIGKRFQGCCFDLLSDSNQVPWPEPVALQDRFYRSSGCVAFQVQVEELFGCKFHAFFL